MSDEPQADEPLKPKLNATNLHVLAEAIAQYEAIKAYEAGIESFGTAKVKVSWDTGGAVRGHSVATDIVSRIVQRDLRNHVQEAVRVAKRDVISKGYEAGIRIDETAL